MLDPPDGTAASCKLYVVLARGVRQAVIFRRGPSKLVRLISWDLNTETFEPGQWLKGRIYERRADLSPNGKLLVYFASDGMKSWTAVSRPPNLTALTIWFNQGTWGGGGQFLSDDHLLLNHKPHYLEASPSHPSPPIRVEWGKEIGGGFGEDEPVYDTRRTRDGWHRVADGEYGKHSYEGEARWIYSSPRIYEHVFVDKKGSTVLRELLHGIFETQGDKYMLEYEVDGRSLGRCHWADWDRNGDLLVSRDGCLFRAKAPDFELVQIADFNEMTFEPIEPTEDARTWPVRGESKRKRKRKRGR